MNIILWLLILGLFGFACYRLGEVKAKSAVLGVLKEIHIENNLVLQEANILVEDVKAGKRELQYEDVSRIGGAMGKTEVIIDLIEVL